MRSIWKWRLRNVEPNIDTDYSALTIPPADFTEKFDNEFSKHYSRVEEVNPPPARSGQATDGELNCVTNDEDDNADAVQGTKLQYMHCEKATRAAAKASLPQKQGGKLQARDVSVRTRNLIKKKKAMDPKKNTTAEFAAAQAAIMESSLQDYKDWVNNRVTEMESAYAANNTRKVFEIVEKELIRKSKPPPQGITTDGQGKILHSAKEAADRWLNFLKSKFAATTRESTRQVSHIPNYRSPTSALTRKEFDDAIRHMSNNKAAGPDSIPVEAIKHCPTVRNALFQIVNTMWEEESIPDGFVKAKFVMLHKKGSADDPANYRCIALLNHAFKILSRIMLVRMSTQCDGFLQDWQAGFRRNRGCRDNITILRTLCQDVLRQGESLTINFVDYAAAFDSVSHRFLDEALAKAGASNKMRAMTRAVYASASAFTTVQGADGKKIKTDVFPINRGVLQGDIMSPLFFILALEYILRMHDNTRGKGAPLSSTPPTRVHTLGYADDLALTDTGNAAGNARATARASEIAAGSRTDADMKVKIVKTKVLHVRPQDPVTETTSSEASKVCKFTCPHLNCGFRFLTKRGMLTHAGRCEWSKEYEVERILACKGPLCARKYLIRWKNYQQEDDTWEPRTNLHPVAIKEFELENSLYDHIAGRSAVPCVTCLAIQNAA